MINNEKMRFSKLYKGQEITNQPEPDYMAIETGRFFTDFYGCWHECKRKDNSIFYMIGEYPQSYY